MSLISRAVGPLWPFIKPDDMVHFPHPLPRGPAPGDVEASDEHGTTPVELERRRLERAESRMRRFCLDLNRLVGRETPPTEDDPDADLTRQIYAAALDAGVDIDDDREWLENARLVLAKLRRDLPEKTWRRLLEASRSDALEDADAQRAIEYARGYLELPEGALEGDEAQATLDLAACLLDYAFVERPRLGVSMEEAATALQRLGGRPTDAVERRSETRVAVREARSLGQLGRAIKVLAVLGGIGGFLLTGQAIFVPVALVALLMAWMLIDKRAIRKEVEAEQVVVEQLESPERRRRLAERLAPPPEKDRLIAEFVRDPQGRETTRPSTELRELWDRSPDPGSRFYRTARAELGELRDRLRAKVSEAHRRHRAGREMARHVQYHVTATPGPSFICSWCGFRGHLAGTFMGRETCTRCWNELGQESCGGCLTKGRLVGFVHGIPLCERCYLKWSPTRGDQSSFCHRCADVGRLRLPSLPHRAQDGKPVCETCWAWATPCRDCLAEISPLADGLCDECRGARLSSR